MLEGFVKHKHVTLPLFKMIPGVERYFLVDGAMFVGKQVDDKKEPATLMNVTDLETGEEGQIICPFLLIEALNADYPDNAYVGKMFAISLTRVPEKKYNLVNLTELKRAEESEESAKPAGKKATK